MKVTEISKYAFESCSSLIDIIIPENVYVIGNGAFRNCSSHKHVQNSPNFTYCGCEIFFHCHLLKEIVLPFNQNTEFRFAGHKLFSLIQNLLIGNQISLNYICS